MILDTLYLILTTLYYAAMKYHIELDIDFKRNTSRGVYIALEGTDGSGKTTQLERLKKELKKLNRTVVTTREPRKNVGLVGKLIQRILHGKTDIPPVAFQYLFSADRAMHHAELILPALERGDVVISDRCFWSAIPYGVMDREGRLDNNTANYILTAQSLLSFYHQFTVPDYTFYLDLPLATAMKRIGGSPDAKEIYEDEEKIKKTIKGYNWLLKEFPKEFIVVDATKSVEEVTKEILSKISSRKK